MKTTTWEVPREQWSTYLRQVEALQRERPVRVELIGPEWGDQTMSARAALRGIAATGARGKPPEAIELDLGHDGQLDHRVLHPVHIFALHAPSGKLECLDIEDESQVKTLIRFEDPLLLGMATPTPRMSRDVLVAEYMSPTPRTLTVGSNIATALDLLRRERIRHLPIVDEEGRLTGVLSDRDLFLVKASRGILPEDVTVDEVMARTPYHVSPQTPIDEAAAVMARRKYGCAVVLEGGRVVGVLTTTDALRALVDLRGRERTATFH